MKIGKNRFQRFVQRKCGVCFDGASATRKIVPREHIALLPMYRYATCRLGSWLVYIVSVCLFFWRVFRIVKM
jgi:hypothetical protein